MYLPHFQNIQDASIVVIEQQLLAVNRDIEQVEDAVYAADQKIESLQITTLLHGEQINVLEQTTSLLEEKVNVLETTDTDILESMTELENADQELNERIDEVENLVGNITVDTELTERVEALERADQDIERRVGELESYVNMTDTEKLEERVNALEIADDVLDARVDRIEEETGAGEGSANDSLPACYGNYSTLTEDYRRLGSAADYNCDVSLEEGLWYRFNLTTGENGLFDQCPQDDTCGTYGPIWMTTAHPNIIGERMKSHVVTSEGGYCDYESYSGDIEVTKCYTEGERFYLYKLWRPTQCYSSYCVRRHDNI